jgi:geranylgeranyl pyrophosphate synthase
MVREIPDHPEYCEQIRRFVAERDGIRYASRRLEEWVARAEQALDAFNPGPAKEALRTIARYTISRQV